MQEHSQRSAAIDRLTTSHLRRYDHRQLEVVILVDRGRLPNGLFVLSIVLGNVNDESAVFEHSHTKLKAAFSLSTRLLTPVNVLYIFVGTK